MTSLGENDGRRRAGRPAGKRRKDARWDSLLRGLRGPRRRETSTDHLEGGDTADVADGSTAPTEAAELPLFKQVSDFELICRNLISTCDYSSIFNDEFAANEQLCGAASALPQTSYRARLKGDAVMRYDARRRNQQRDEMAIRLHSNNQQHWSPSMIARSVAYFGKTSRLLRQNEMRQRRIASKPTTLRAMHIMKKHRPRPEWAQGMHVKCFGYDQTYQWVGVKKRGRRQAVERLDSAGLPIQVQHEVYINSIDVALPTRLGTLSQVHVRMHTPLPHACTWAHLSDAKMHA